MCSASRRRAPSHRRARRASCSAFLTFAASSLVAGLRVRDVDVVSRDHAPDLSGRQRVAHRGDSGAGR